MDPDSDEGYLLVFRELNNEETVKTIPLNFMAAGQTLQVADLRSGKSGRVTADAKGAVKLRIETPADFLFLKYEVL